jgi:hypothetical protein
MRTIGMWRFSFERLPGLSAAAVPRCFEPIGYPSLVSNTQVRFDRLVSNLTNPFLAQGLRLLIARCRKGPSLIDHVQLD